MSKDQMKAAIERHKGGPKPPPPQASVPKQHAQPPQKKKERKPFLKFRLPAGSAFAFQQRVVGEWHGTLSGVNADGTPFSYEMTADGVHRLARELGKKWRAEHGPKE